MCEWSITFGLLMSLSQASVTKSSKAEEQIDFCYKTFIYLCSQQSLHLQ